MPVVEVSTQENICVLRLNSPQTKNALSPEVVVRMARALKAAKENPDVRVVVLTGSGDSFCSGADLGRLIPLLTGMRKPSDEFDHALVEDPTLTDVVFGKGFSLGKPTIAVLNGITMAGGFEIMLTSHIRVASADARFALREAAVGLIPGGGGCARLPRAVARAHAMEILLTAGIFPASKAQSIGLVNYVENTPEEALAKGMALAKMVSSMSPNSIARILDVTSTLDGTSEEAALAKESEAMMMCMGHPDAREGPLAFKQKRAPKWAKL